MAHCSKCAQVSLKEIVPVVKQHATVSYGGGKGIQVFCLTTLTTYKFIICWSVTDELTSMKN
jgi:hypothetical protein